MKPLIWKMYYSYLILQVLCKIMNSMTFILLKKIGLENVMEIYM